MGPRPPNCHSHSNTNCHFAGLAWVRDRLNERLGSRHGGVQAPVTACLACQYDAGRGALPWHFDEMRAHGEAQVSSYFSNFNSTVATSVTLIVP